MRKHGSISSEGSLTWSDSSYTNDSELPQTPPDTPRHSSFQFERSPPSWSRSEDGDDEQEMEITTVDAFSTLDLSSNPFTSPTKSVKTAHISKWASELRLSPPSPSELPSPFKSSKAKRPGLKMDLSNIPGFEYAGNTHSPRTAQLINAPRIGCEPSPSPTAMNFSPITPRPSLVSRFSDESSSSGSSPSAETPPVQQQSGLLPSPAKLALPGLTGPQPMTPRTVDALDCFGISSSATSCLMSRGRSKDKLGQSPGGRLFPRSPLSLPPSNAYFSSASDAGSDTTMRSPSSRLNPSSYNPYFISAVSAA